MIPDDLGGVTAEWLAGVLDAPVRSVEVVDRHDGTTGRARLRLGYAEPPGLGRPETLFAKLPPSDPAQRAFVRKVGLGVAEARFYRDVGELPVRVPGVHYADCDDEGRYLMLLEDVVASGCRFPRPRDPGVLDHVRSLMVEFAKLHAHFWESPRLEGDLAWISKPASAGSHRGISFIERALELFGADQPREFRSLCELYIERAAEIAETWRRGPQTLIHGDAHLGNLFLDGERMAFLDWAMVSSGNGVHDVSYVLCNSIAPELRREHERELLSLYRQELLRRGVPAEDAETVWFRHRLSAIYSWVSSAATAAMGSRWQPARIGRAGLRRTTAAIVELDSLGAAAEALGGA